MQLTDSSSYCRSMYRDACAHLQLQTPTLKHLASGSVLGDATNLVTPPAKLSSRSRTAETAVKTDQGKLSSRGRAAANPHHTSVRQPRPSRWVFWLVSPADVLCSVSQSAYLPQGLHNTACEHRVCVHCLHIKRHMVQDMDCRQRLPLSHDTTALTSGC